MQVFAGIPTLVRSGEALSESSEDCHSSANDLLATFGDVDLRDSADHLDRHPSRSLSVVLPSRSSHSRSPTSAKRRLKTRSDSTSAGNPFSVVAGRTNDVEAVRRLRQVLVGTRQFRQLSQVSVSDEAEDVPTLTKSPM